MDGGAGQVDSERSAGPRRSTVVLSVLALVTVVAGVALVVGALVVTSFVGQRLSELHLAPMHPRLYYDAMQYGVPLLGLLLVCGGIALAIVTAVRRRPRRT